MNFSKRKGLIMMAGVLLLAAITLMGFKYVKQSDWFSLVKSKNASVSELDKALKTTVINMPIEEKIGQLIMPDFRKYNNKAVTVINKEIGAMIKNYHLGGIILFKENFVTEKQTQLLLQNFQKYAKIPLMFGVDQEGGVVTRMPFFPRMPGNMALGATDNPELSKKVGIAIGSELSRLGIQINFGPVLDINNNPDNPVIGVRSFGDNAEIVTKMGLAYMEGLNQAGIVAVAKHFPGHGDVNADSHYVLPSSSKSLNELTQLELKPFQAAINKGIQGVMAAHIIFNKLDNRTAISIKDGLPIQLPATLSDKVMNGLLRKKMGFKGVVFSDAMVMNAVSNHFAQVDAAIRAINAGVDVILMPEDTKLVYQGLLKAVKTGKLSKTRVDESVERILKLKAKYVYNANTKNKTSLSMNAAVDLEKEIASSAVTLVKNDGLIPLKADEKDKFAVIGFQQGDIDNVRTAIGKDCTVVTEILLSKNVNYKGTLDQNQKEKLSKATKVIIVTNIADAKNDNWQISMVQNIIGQGIPTIAVAARNPYGIAGLKGKYAAVAQYDTGLASFYATSDVMFGRLEAKGKLPVRLEK